VKDDHVDRAAVISSVVWTQVERNVRWHFGLKGHAVIVVD